MKTNIGILLLTSFLLLLSLNTFGQRVKSSTSTETFSIELKKGKNVIRSQHSNTVIHIDYDHRANTYTVEVPRYRTAAQTVTPGAHAQNLRFTSKRNTLTLSIKETGNTLSREGRQKNRRVEMEVVFE